MGSLFTGFSAEELDAQVESLIFEKDEIVEGEFIDAKMDAKYGNLVLLCKVSSGSNAGKTTEVYIKGKSDVRFLVDIAMQFGKAFFSREELMRPAGIPCAKLVGLKFKCRALEPKEHNGKMYQTFNDWKNEGSSIPF